MLFVSRLRNMLRHANRGEYCVRTALTMRFIFTSALMSAASRAMSTHSIVS